jgi:surfeit locus 1 family protein
MMDTLRKGESRRAVPLLGLLLAVAAFAILVGLGIWQVQRLHWKEGLLETIAARMAETPRSLGEIEALLREGSDVDYRPMTAEGRFHHTGERHVLATRAGQSGWHVYTPLALADGRFLFVNRGFVPYDLKDPAKRPVGQIEGEVRVQGLARTAPQEKPSFIVPDNDPAANLFYWKDLQAMGETAGLPADADVLPFFLDTDATPTPGGFPVGGTTRVDLPNNHLQYAMTWFGLAAALLAVTIAMFLRRRRGGHQP